MCPLDPVLTGGSGLSGRMGGGGEDLNTSISGSFEAIPGFEFILFIG